jgi:zinc D-Ala-D-Ala carboxypeptidase
MHRDNLYAALTKMLALLFLPVAAMRSRGHGRYLSAQWALRLRFPAEDLRGLTPATYWAFTVARTEALWRDGQLIGLTSGHRDAAVQHSMYMAELGSTGLPTVLPPERSAHVRGIALDVRPREGALWLEAHGGRYGLYRIYDNEWWHFEHRAGGPPVRLPYPGASRPRYAAPGRPTTVWR